MSETTPTLQDFVRACDLAEDRYASALARLRAAEHEEQQLKLERDIARAAVRAALEYGSDEIEIDATGVAHHVDAEGSVDYDRDDDHVPYSSLEEI